MSDYDVPTPMGFEIIIKKDKATSIAREDAWKYEKTKTVTTFYLDIPTDWKNIATKFDKYALEHLDIINKSLKQYASEQMHVKFGNIFIVAPFTELSDRIYVYWKNKNVVLVLNNLFSNPTIDQKKYLKIQTADTANNDRLIINCNQDGKILN